MRVVSDQSWSRRGLSLLWGAEALSRIAQPDQVVSVRQLFALSRAWPEDLPAVNGNAQAATSARRCRWADVFGLVLIRIPGGFSIVAKRIKTRMGPPGSDSTT